MIRPELLHRTNIQEPATKSLGIEQVRRPLPQRSAQPAGQRNTESHLRALDKFTRHIVIEHPTQQPFGFTIAHPKVARQLPGELDYTVIEQGGPYFERYRHRRAIDFLQDVIGQICGRIE